MAVLPSGVAAPTSSAGRKSRRRKPNRRLIKIPRNLTIDEAARVTGCSKETIRRWINSGALPAITDRKPHIILGGDLADYLEARTEKGPKLEPGQFYCFGCRARRKAALGKADYRPLTATTGNLRARCDECTTTMHKAVSFASLSALAGILDVSMQQAREHLTDTSNPSLNEHFDKESESNA